MKPFPTRRGRFGTVMAVSTVAAMLALSACGGSSSGSGGSAASGKNLNVVGFSVIQSPYKDLAAGFAQTAAGKGVTVAGSYGASGAQSRAVIAGQKADIVAFSLEPDLKAVVDAGKVDANWKSGATKGIASSSVVVIAVRAGNPKKITGWNDIIKPGVKIVTADPGTSGSAKWNLLGAYVSAAGKSNDEAAGTAYLKKFVANVVSWNDSGRDATNAFSKGTGDILISYENEAITARANGVKLDYIVPDTSILIQNPDAVTKTAPASATAFLSYIESAEGQTILAKDGFRPVNDIVKATNTPGANDPTNPFPAVKNLFTIDDLGGWSEANTKFFDKTNGLVTKLRAS